MARVVELLVSRTLGLVDGRVPSAMPAIRARNADGGTVFRGDEAGWILHIDWILHIVSP